jgi:hypothetical protein
MPYVARDKSGAIIAVFKDKNRCAHENVSPYDHDLRSFLGQNSSADEERSQYFESKIIELRTKIGKSE